ncbi:hypothetical protein C8F04DRAFT_1232758 [Mycena alexandri]|uniref:Uncharacterized protein n=1 Tax=Mycena alexandri TaxID=1745969 RepID=A0AAD6T0A8_9AGAR|nr:hypothetical protein C8F04DRAFT_1232758 [Mycena alexandri]
MQYDHLDDFFDASGQAILFSAGHLPDPLAAQRTEMQQQIDRLSFLPNHSLFGQVSEQLQDETDPESTVDGAFAAALRRMGIDDDESDDAGEEEFHFSKADEDEAWFPHGSRTMFMLDLLDNLPRLRLSDDHLKAIIWVMRECRTPNVPSFSLLRKKQESLTREVGVTSQQHTSSLGNHFYMNHPSKLLALDWANPLVRPFILLEYGVMANSSIKRKGQSRPSWAQKSLWKRGTRKSSRCRGMEVLMEMGHTEVLVGTGHRKSSSLGAHRYVNPSWSAGVVIAVGGRIPSSEVVQLGRTLLREPVVVGGRSDCRWGPKPIIGSRRRGASLSQHLLKVHAPIGI